MVERQANTMNNAPYGREEITINTDQISLVPVHTNALKLSKKHFSLNLQTSFARPSNHALKEPWSCAKKLISVYAARHKENWREQTRIMMYTFGRFKEIKAKGFFQFSSSFSSLS